MTPEKRAQARRDRQAAQAAEDARVQAHADAHRTPESEAERARVRALLHDTIKEIS